MFVLTEGILKPELNTLTCSSNPISEPYAESSSDLRVCSRHQHFLLRGSDENFTLPNPFAGVLNDILHRRITLDADWHVTWNVRDNTHLLGGCCLSNPSIVTLKVSIVSLKSAFSAFKAFIAPSDISNSSSNRLSSISRRFLSSNV